MGRRLHARPPGRGRRALTVLRGLEHAVQLRQPPLLQLRRGEGRLEAVAGQRVRLRGPELGPQGPGHSMFCVIRGGGGSLPLRQKRVRHFYFGKPVSRHPQRVRGGSVTLESKGKFDSGFSNKRGKNKIESKGERAKWAKPIFQLIWCRAIFCRPLPWRRRSGPKKSLGVGVSQ